MQLHQEVAYCKKEVNLLKAEQDTVESVASTQCSDIERYLRKEIGILEDIINKSQGRQTADNNKFYGQINQTSRMIGDLNDERCNCVMRMNKVQDTLGVPTDNMDQFKQPLKIQGALQSNTQQEVM